MKEAFNIADAEDAQRFSNIQASVLSPCVLCVCGGESYFPYLQLQSALS
jgi:hypothetical protein